MQLFEGYGVALVLIDKETMIAGLTLRQSGLRERDLMVLSIEWVEGVISVSKAQGKINVEDRLIGYRRLKNSMEIVLSVVTPNTKQNQGKLKGGRND